MVYFDYKFWKTWTSCNSWFWSIELLESVIWKESKLYFCEKWLLDGLAKVLFALKKIKALVNKMSYDNKIIRKLSVVSSGRCPTFECGGKWGVGQYSILRAKCRFFPPIVRGGKWGTFLVIQKSPPGMIQEYYRYDNLLNYRSTINLSHWSKSE